MITPTGVGELIPANIDQNTQPPMTLPQLIHEDHDTDRLRGNILSQYPRFWLRIMREIQIAIQTEIDKQSQVTRERNRMLAALVIQNRKPLQINRLALNDAEHGQLIFCQAPNGEIIVNFKSAIQSPVLVTGDTNILRMPGPNGKKK